MRSSNFSEWLVFAFILVVGSIFIDVKIRWLVSRIRSYFIFLPLMAVLYILFSHFLSEQSISESVVTGLLAMLKFFSLIILMTIYLERSNGGDFLHSLRSLWVRTGWNWKWVDHSFIFLYLVFRFYPAIQIEWETMKKSQQALQIPVRKSRIGHLSEILKNIPVLIVLYLHRSDLMSELMLKRGYGNHFPRGIADPVKFEFSHIFAMAVITIFLMGAGAIAKI